MPERAYHVDRAIAMSVNFVIACPEGEIILTFIGIDVEIIHRQVIECG
jgi:hypothetical protein